MQASEGESESSEGSSDEEERAGSIAPSVLPAPNATTNSGPSSFASRNDGFAGGKDKERIGRRRRGRGTMKRGRRMSSLPLHQRTLGRKIQGRNPRGEGSLDRQLVC
jgi:hypothetical protein